MAKSALPTPDGKYLFYNGKPLVREGNTICYGDMNDKYVLILEVFAYAGEGDQKIPSKILIQIADPKNPANILKQDFGTDWADAFSRGMTWLEYALKSA